MAVTLRSPHEIELMRVAGKLAADVLIMIEPYVKAGVTTGELDDICQDYIENTQHAISACLGYHGYPKCVCISVNEEICHGIPGTRHLKNGDIVNIDVTVIKDNYYGDTSKMFIVGGHTVPINSRLVKTTQECLYAGLRTIYAGSNLMDIGAIIQKIADREGFSIVRDYCGHGIGNVFHDEPTVLHYKNKDSLVLQEGMTFTVEPMINVGTWKTKVNKKNGWTVTTADKLGSAQYEHTIVVTKDGCEVLTIRPEEEEAGVISRILHNRPE